MTKNTAAVNETSNRHIKSMLAQRWRERSWRGVWFYGTWLFNRYYGTTILLNIVAFVAALLVVTTLPSR